MPKLMISKCYKEILEVPSLWWLFPEEEWRFICELPFLVALWIVSERLIAQLSSPSMWGQAGVEFILGSNQKISGEIIPMPVLITDGVEEGNLGMVTTFYHHDQANVESSEALSILCQWDSPKLSVVVVKIFANSPYLPQGSSSFLYLDVTTLSWGTLTAQFPFDQMCLLWLLPYSPTQVVLQNKAEDEELKVYPILQEALWESSKEDHHLSDPILLSVPPSPFIKKRACRQRRGLVSALLWHGYKALPWPKPNLSKS